MKKFVSVALSATLLATPAAKIASADEPPKGAYVFDTDYKTPAPNQIIVFKEHKLFGKKSMLR